MGSSHGHDIGAAAIARRLTRRLPAGSPVGHGGDAVVVGVRPGEDEVVVLLRWFCDPRLYGVPVDVSDTGTDYYYRGIRIDSLDQWIESVALGLDIEIATGLRSRARRRRRGDLIELRRDGGWPTDERFACHEVLGYHDETERALAADGIDPSPARRERLAGRLRGWVIATRNTTGGSRWLGQAVVAATGRDTGTLCHLEVAAGVPASVRIDLARLACQMAAGTGLARIRTLDADPDLALLGFRPTEAGGRMVDCDFLDADPDAARRRLAADLAAADPRAAALTLGDAGATATASRERSGRWWQAIRQNLPTLGPRPTVTARPPAG